jgi:hypothetical protein
MTPWVMAHRVSHAISSRSKSQSFEYLRKNFFDQINDIIENTYNYKLPPYISKGYNPFLDSQYRAIFNAIGTQRSSRKGLVKRPQEFLHELFAQYIKTGSIKLKRFPNSLSYGKKAWGKPINTMGTSEDKSSLEGISIVLGRDLEYYFDLVLDEAVGKIYLM